MRSTSFITLALAACVRANKYDNSAEAASIDSAASTLSGEGNYVFTNVATGKTLSFVRTDLTNVYPNDNGDSMAVQFSGTQARMSGANNKCISAQWQAIIGRGYDNAAVAYACKVGTGLLTGTDTLEPTKQWWYLLPAGTTTATATSPSASAAATASDSATVVVELAAVSSSSDDDENDDDDGNEDDDEVSATATTTSHRHYPSGVDPHNRLTWICLHSGKWVAARPGYVKKHPECADDMAAYLASQRVAKRRRSHAEMARRVRARAQQTYYIIAVDHILDAATRAIGSESITTPGGYLSTVLNEWDQTDDSQLWTITPA